MIQSVGLNQLFDLLDISCLLVVITAVAHFHDAHFCVDFRGRVTSRLSRDLAFDGEIARELSKEGCRIHARRLLGCRDPGEAPTGPAKSCRRSACPPAGGTVSG